jgi:hypothetical protein
VWKNRPRHDDASHGAEAFTTFAYSRIADEEEPRSRESDRCRRPYTRHHGPSWMAA